MKRELTHREARALKNFADFNGDRWKCLLVDLWHSSSAPALLQGLNQSHGFEWLMRFQFGK